MISDHDACAHQTALHWRTAYRSRTQPHLGSGSQTPACLTTRQLKALPRVVAIFMRARSYVARDPWSDLSAERGRIFALLLLATLLHRYFVAEVSGTLRQPQSPWQTM